MKFISTGRTRLVPIALLAAVSTLPACADCNHQAERSLSEDLVGIERVELVAKAGDLEIEAGGSTLEASGTACASKARLLEEIQLVAERSGSTLRVEVETPDTSGWNQQARLDLRVSLPATMSLEVTDGSGDIEARGVTISRLKDGSGDSRLTETRGDLRLSDGSGDVTLRGHQGSVELKDGSGDLRLRDVAGSVLITSDGSGGIDIETVEGDVEVRSDGSGDIDVETVSGDLRVGSAGSGDVRHRGVAGNVDVPRKD